MEEIVFRYATLILIGVLVGYLIGYGIFRCSIKAREHEIYLNGFRYAELDRKCKFYIDRDKKLTEVINDLERDIISKEKSIEKLEKNIEKLEKSKEKLKVENKALVEKAILSGAQNIADEDYINYLKSLLDESNITYNDRQVTQRILGDESNEY